MKRELTFDEAVELILLRDSAFRLFLQTAPFPVWCKYYTDGSGRMLFLSSVYEELYSVTAHEYVGRSDFDIWPKEVAEEF